MGIFNKKSKTDLTSKAEKRNLLQLKKGSYELECNLNVLEAFQDRYGSITRLSELGQGGTGLAMLKCLLCAMISEAVDIAEESGAANLYRYTEAELGRELGVADIDKLTVLIQDVVTNGMGESDSEELEDDDPNA